MIIISLFLLGTLMPNLSFTAHVNVGIVNGSEAKPHSRPYMVSLQKDGTHTCGGFLISDEFVMSAGHCWNKGMILTVVVGAHDLSSKKENSAHIRVKDYHRHPGYIREPSGILNDIMILRLEVKVKLNNNVKRISIPKKEGDITPGFACSVAGWGRLDTTGPQSERLMETNVKLLNNTKCNETWEPFYVAQQMMCAYGHGGTCEGDSGGPLVCGNSAVGVTSFGDTKQCNSADYPEVYTKISAFLPWIHSILKKK